MNLHFHHQQDRGGSASHWTKNSYWTLMGIISTIKYPCGSGEPSRHVRVQPFLEWIYNTTEVIPITPDPNATTRTSTQTISTTATTNPSSGYSFIHNSSLFRNILVIVLAYFSMCLMH